MPDIMGAKDIAFPHLGIYLENVPKSFSVFGFEIALYGFDYRYWCNTRRADGCANGKTRRHEYRYYLGFCHIRCHIFGDRGANFIMSYFHGMCTKANR